MKTRIIKCHINAFYTYKPEETARLMNDGEKIRLPEKLIRQAADIAGSVLANTKEDNHDRASAVAAYVLRYAYLLNQQGELIEAPPKPKREKKPHGGET